MPLDDRHSRSEAAKHLSELATDVAPAQHDEVTRQFLEIHHPMVIDPRHRLETGNRRHRRPAAGIDDYDVGAVAPAGDVDFALADEARRPFDDAQPLARSLQSTRGAFAPASHHRVLARDDHCEIDMDHCLRRCATVARACSAEERALDESDLAAAVRQSHGKGHARLAASDDQHVDSHRARRSRRAASVLASAATAPADAPSAIGASSTCAAVPPAITPDTIRALSEMGSVRSPAGIVDRIRVALPRGSASATPYLSMAANVAREARSQRLRPVAFFAGAGGALRARSLVYRMIELARSSAQACFGRDAADLLTLDRARQARSCLALAEGNLSCPSWKRQCNRSALTDVAVPRF